MILLGFQNEQTTDIMKYLPFFFRLMWRELFSQKDVNICYTNIKYNSYNYNGEETFKHSIV